MFLVLSEATGTLRYAVLVQPLFWLIGLAVLLTCVDVEAAQREAEQTLHLRHFGKDAKRENPMAGAPPAPTPASMDGQIEMRANAMVSQSTTGEAVI